MKLPKNIYDAVKAPFAHHGCWHYMRSGIPSGAVRQGCFKGLLVVGAAGSGRQFLEFHRDMIRNFKWFVANTPGPRYDYRPWQELPAWLANLMDASLPQYRASQMADIDYIVQFGDSDELGIFLEGSNNPPAPGIHGYIHGLVSRYESTYFGVQPYSDMGSQMTAVYNEHFWGLHGWIDEFFAAWQRLRGEPVDQSPVAPKMMGPMCPECTAIADRGIEMDPLERTVAFFDERNTT